MNSTVELTIPQINQMLVERGVDNVIQHLVGDTAKRSGGYLHLGNVSGEKGESLAIYAAGSKAGRWVDNATEQKGDLVEFWTLNRGLSKADALKEIREYLGIAHTAQVKSKPKQNHLRPVPPQPPTETKEQKLAKHLSGVNRVSEEALTRNHNRLMGNGIALKWLQDRGFTTETIGYFRLGLAAPYKKGTDTETRGALIFPTINELGLFVTPNPRYNIPNVTVNPTAKKGWCRGDPSTCYNTRRLPSHRFLMVVEGFKDLWSVHQMLQGTDLVNKVLIVTSTHGTNIPREVEYDPMFFEHYDKVFIATDNDEAGDTVAQKWATYTGLKGHRVRSSIGKDWNDLLMAGGSADDLVKSLKAAESMRAVVLNSAPKKLNDYRVGQTYGYKPIDISGAYLDGHLYYPVIVHDVGLDEQTQAVAHSRVIKVVRSDKQILDYRQLPMLKRPGAIQTPLYTLSDGTLIDNVPKVSPSTTWDWDYVNAWLEGRFNPRPLDTIVKEIESVLRGQIWLPDQENYLVLALVVVATYVQSVFDAVPMILATGEKGTGKSHVGMVMAKMACNAEVIGAVSSATLIRTIDECRGFVVLDDLEKISNKTKGASATETDEMLQTLKVSYKKSTAIKKVTDTKTMSVQKLNSFGIKFMTNTTGVEEILGSRTITIDTQRAPKGHTFKDIDDEDLMHLQNELHAWAMDNVKHVDDAYKPYKTSNSNRTQEITSPLRALVDVSGQKELHDTLDVVVERLEQDQKQVDSPEQILREAVFSLAAQGFESISMEQVVLEMKTLVPRNYMKSYTTEIPEWQQEDWVRKNLYSFGFIPKSTPTKFRAYGSKVRLSRLYKLEPQLYKALEQEDEVLFLQYQSAEKLSGKDFCKRYGNSCKGCAYERLGCPIQSSTGKNNNLIFSH